MFELKVVSFFSAAHSLRQYQGKCESIHGHNWKVELRVRAARLDNRGLLLDFKELKNILNQVLEQLDHKDLNQIGFFKENNPSSENIALFIYRQVGPKIKKNCSLEKVTVWEQRDSAASFYEE